MKLEIPEMMSTMIKAMPEIEIGYVRGVIRHLAFGHCDQQGNLRPTPRPYPANPVNRV